MVKTQEGWRGKESQDLRSQFFGRSSGEKRVESFDQKSLNEGIKLESQANKFQYKKDQRLVDDYTKDQAEQINRILELDAKLNSFPELKLPAKEKLARHLERRLNSIDSAEEAGAVAFSNLEIKSVVENNAKNLLNMAPESVLALGAIYVAIWLIDHTPKTILTGIKKTYDKVPRQYKLIFILSLSAIILAACGATAGTPIKEATPSGGNSPQAGETTGLPTEGSAATAKPAETATLSPEEQIAVEIGTKIKADPFYNSTYVQAKEATNDTEIPNGCGVMVNELIANKEILSTQFVDVGVTSSGNCYVTWEENGIRTVVYESKDKNGYLYVNYDPAEHDEGATFEYKDAPHGLWAAVMVDNKPVEGVNGATSQWENFVDGQFIDASGKATPVPSPTPINPSPGETHPVVQTIDPAAINKIVADYESGVLNDVSSLSSEQHAAFSEAFVEKLREQRGTNVVYYTYKGDKYFINPNTLESELAPANPDQKFLKENTLEIYLPVRLNAEGKLVVNVDGKSVTIENSVGTDWNMVVTDPHDPRINWPDVAKLGFGDFPDLTPLQFYLAEKNIPSKTSNIVPIIIMDKEIGEIILEAGPAFRRDAFLKIATIETDANGTPIFAKVSLMFGGAGLVLQEEGSGKEVVVGAKLREGFDFWETMEENSAYYLGFPINQSTALSEGMFSSTNNLDGFAPMDQNLNTLTGDGLKQNKTSLIFAHTLIKKAK